MEARLAERGLRPARRVRERVLARDAGGRRVRADRLRPLLLDDRHDRLAGLRRRAGAALDAAGHRSSSSTTPSSATASRRSRPATRPRCGRRTSSCSCARRFAVSRRGTAWSRRLRRSRGRTTPATAATSTSRSGPASGTASTTARRRTSSRQKRARSSQACSTHLPGLCGLAAPSFNSYRRIVPQYWAGAFVCWGHDNREATVRVASVLRGVGGGLDECRAEGVRRELQPLPRAWAG